ncbi:helix-turn-helix domain-containing protein [Paenibacillus eucommiae]|uniref:AraC-like DNA-binding protein n=1 Tax=Paenibacillus eucommiae TaxID=1355755 RepID=A0ABS4IT43_9BACL|nr:helix-turn-helix domain-containing protein [Paenibacillus eucommiae]MBP1990727.1 AraC-like DNA-binding protein [Paenibacillus eucommiae]
MKRQGYHRWLLAYLPIFFIIIAVLILIFFLAMSSYSRKQTVMANEVFAGHMMQTIDASLEYTDQMIVKELITDEKLRLFYDTRQQLSPFDYYEISQRIKDITTAFPPIKSIYLYRTSDQTVLTTNTMVPLAQFGDRAFVEAAVREGGLPYAWTPSRIYLEFDRIQYKMNVITLSKQVPLGSGSQGLLVVNMLTSSIRDMFPNLSEMKDVYVQLSDANETLLFGEPLPAARQLSEVKSAYTGWVIKSGLKNKQAYSLFVLFSNIWFKFGLFTVLSGTFWMVYIVRRNYRPIEAIKNRVQLYASQTNSLLGNKGIDDEFHFISHSIENLIETSNSYERQYKENLIFRKRWLFDALIDGESPVDLEQWQQEMGRLGLSEGFDQLAISVLEIDRYPDFSTHYSHSDQQLLKFAVGSVMKEMAPNHSLYIWNEWVSHYQMGILFTLTKEHEDKQLAVYTFCETVRCWIGDNLKFTVSFGVGGLVSSILEASQSYHNGLEALQYKPVLGMNRTIGFWEINRLPQGQIYHHLPSIRLMAQYYRLGEEEWKHYYNELLHGLKTVISPRDEIISLMSYVIYTMQKEMSLLPVEMNSKWEQQALQTLNQALSRFDVLDELEVQFYEILDQAATSIHALREKRDNHTLIHEVRQYIRENYTNQDLSLTHLSDKFLIQSKNLSRIFKEEFGENFVDYLTTIRMEQAKLLLAEYPDKPVQEIAQSVGYNHSMSFIRVFKKLEGLTPGDFRREMC